MTDPPVATREIADLLHRIRELSDNPTSDPTERAEVLARKADLLARLANQRADARAYEHPDQARPLAREPRTPATQARGAAPPQQHDPISQ
jgi:hypothetical protein